MADYTLSIGGGDLGITNATPQMSVSMAVVTGVVKKIDELEKALAALEKDDE